MSKLITWMKFYQSKLREFDPSNSFDITDKVIVI